MKKILLVLTLFITSFSYALHVECVGKATLLTHDGDTLLVFASSPELKTLNSVGEVDWYRLPDTITPVQTGTDYFYPEHGEGYMVKVGTERDVFWVFDYDSLRADVHAITATLDCENTELRLEGTVPQLTYRNIHQAKKTYPRQCTVTYTNSVWNSEQSIWEDSVAVEEVEYQEVIRVGASPIATDFSISDLLARQLELAEDPLQSTVYEPVAIKANPQAIVTVRGVEGEPTNEVERPVDPETILKRSAPLTITFKANALNATHYTWNLYHGTIKQLQRNEAQHQYVFEEPGNYRMVVGVSNDKCALDSIEFLISVSESMLKVPNVFTPNGDGANDEFRVVYRSLKEFHCWIYNRWGHLVYEWTDPAKGWDGTIGGRPAAEGAYYYVIRALGTDAEEGYMAKTKYAKKLKKQELPIGVYQLSGDINLLRGGK